MQSTQINWAKAGGLPEEIWLASQSPRRRQLIQTLGVDAKVYLAQQGIEAELLETPQDGEAPPDYVERVTQLKLQAAPTALTLEKKFNRSL